MRAAVYSVLDKGVLFLLSSQQQNRTKSSEMSKDSIFLTESLAVLIQNLASSRSFRVTVLLSTDVPGVMLQNQSRYSYGHMSVNFFIAPEIRCSRSPAATCSP